MTAELLFKVLNNDGSAFFGGKGKWPLPTKNDDGTWTPGDWMPPIEGELVPCKNGYHLCRERDLIQWLGPAIFATEYQGERIGDDDKIVVRTARLLNKYEIWNEETARLFACDCAERVVHLCDDPRAQKAIEVARCFVNGEATEEDLAAARSAAWAAARAAARSAAREAARAAARSAAREAAWAAAKAAARSAAWAAAKAAARAAAWAADWDSERRWQTNALVHLLDGTMEAINQSTRGDTDKRRVQCTCPKTDKSNS